MRFAFFCLASLLGVAAALGGKGAPAYLANQNPFALVYALPKAESGFITQKGKLDAAFLYYVSNNAYSDEAPNGETMVWDGETATYTLKLRYGLFERLEVGMDVHYVQHSGGYLDSVIRNFHDLFGFPNGRQEQFDKDQIEYTVNGKNYMNGSHHGMGDLRFTAGVPLILGSENERRHLAARSVLKLPTGDPDYLLGSGGTDISAGLSYSDFELLGFMNMVVSANFGILYMGDSDVLAEMHNKTAGFGGAAVNWQALKWLELKLQMDLHSAMYDTELIQLGTSLQVVAGGTIQLPGDVFLDLGITEQLTTDATPDYGMYLMVGYQF